MASDVHKNTDTKVETVSANSVCRQLPQKTAEQGLAAAVAFAEEVQWSLAIRRTISGVGFGEALKLLMNDRDMSVEQMESESGLSVSTVKRLRAGQDASVEQIVAISVALHLPPPVSGDLLRMCGITLDFNNQKNTVYQMILTEYYKEGIEQVNVCLAACGCVEQIVAISVALHLPPPVSGDLLRMCGITLDFNNQKNTVYQMILTEYYKEGIEQVNVCLAACGCAPLKTAC